MDPFKILDLEKRITELEKHVRVLMQLSPKAMKVISQQTKIKNVEPQKNTETV